MYNNILMKKCLRCGHEWISNVEEPKQCPKCKQYYYNKPRTWVNNSPAESIALQQDNTSEEKRSIKLD